MMADLRINLLELNHLIHSGWPLHRQLIQATRFNEHLKLVGVGLFGRH